ncbi:hypothetical protein GRC92_17890 [Streptococcus thermophilus]|nr:hypothetical protein [Streptococcus thermophilus]
MGQLDFLLRRTSLPIIQRFNTSFNDYFIGRLRSDVGGLSGGLSAG